MMLVRLFRAIDVAVDRAQAAWSDWSLPSALLNRTIAG
jgi:hypothetical protein